MFSDCIKTKLIQDGVCRGVNRSYTLYEEEEKFVLYTREGEKRKQWESEHSAIFCGRMLMAESFIVSAIERDDQLLLVFAKIEDAGDSSKWRRLEMDLMLYDWSIAGDFLLGSNGASAAFVIDLQTETVGRITDGSGPEHVNLVDGELLFHAGKRVWMNGPWMWATASGKAFQEMCDEERR